MYQRNNNVLWRELDGETVLLDPTAGCSYNLNRAGTLIWKMLDGKHTLNDLVTAVCQTYEVENEQALHDIEILLAEMRDNNLLTDSGSLTHKVL